MKTYIMKCEHCGVPISDNTKVCPYCGQHSTAEAVVEDKNLTVDNGMMTIKNGGHLDIGNTLKKNKIRECPFCGDMVKSSKSICPSCGNKLFIEVLRIQKKLVVEGSLTVGSGGKLIVGPSEREDALRDAIKKGDMDAVKKQVFKGVDLNFSDSKHPLPLYLAVSEGKVEIAQFLISMGANAGKQKKKILALTGKLDCPELVQALKMICV